MPKPPHTAITTWSGYVYQGKVALYHALKLILELGADTCTDYQLQLDSLEDFSILNRDFAPISLHQVKALKSHYASTYEGAFVKLKNNHENGNTCDVKWFHVAQEITDKTPTEIATAHSPIKLYPYGTDHWCPVDEIDTMIEGIIGAICAIVHQGDQSKQSEVYIKAVRSYLDGIVLTQILKIHKKVHDNLVSDRQAALKETIAFTDFINLLREDVAQKAISEDYYFYILLNDLLVYYQEYCIENEDRLSEEERIKLSQSMLRIESLNISLMVQFIRSIIPHREFKFDNLKAYKDNTFDQEDVRDVFLVILHKLKEPNFNLTNFIHWQVGGSTFVPSTIMQSQRNAENICERIIKNAKSTDVEILFEADKIITDAMDVESIAALVPEAISSDEGDEEMDKGHITKWRGVSLISLERAEEDIK